MRVLIIGAAGMIGAKLARRLAEDRQIAGRPITALELADLGLPVAPPGDLPCRCRALDITAEGAAEDLVSNRPDVIFHLAAMVSGAAERDFEGGYRVNVDASRALFEAIRRAHEAEGYAPRLVFASSLAVYGAPLPDPVPDDQIRTPRSSYGTQKAIVELLLDDYSRRCWAASPTISPARPTSPACWRARACGYRCAWASPTRRRPKTRGGRGDRAQDPHRARGRGGGRLRARRWAGCARPGRRASSGNTARPSTRRPPAISARWPRR
jgi:NAD(P)-dependent dehydrogenase (short-subunit alcohol dehydrogenase family)